MPVARVRLALVLSSAAAIGLELALMRALSLRFWHHLAHMVVAVALVGFGASGTALTFLRKGIAARPREWLWRLGLLFALSIVLVPRVAGVVPLNVHFLAWNIGEAGNVLLIELALFVPFLLVGGIVGIALTDAPERLGGHYAANLVGSGLGAVLTLAAMHALGTGGLFTMLALAAWVGGAALVPCRRATAAGAAAVTLLAVLASAVLAPWQPSLSQYKTLSLLMDMPGTSVLHRVEGPLGRIDVVAGPSVRHAPGLSLQYSGPVPPHVLMVTDGDGATAVYDCARREDWEFVDWTTAAAAWHLVRGRRALVVGAGGGSDIGLALYHGSTEIVALEMNPQVIGLMTGPLRDRGGAVYLAEHVQVVNQEARGYLAGTVPRFDIMQVPALDAFGASGAGLYATQESYLYTVEAFGRMLDRLAEGGVLSITRWARTPPRDELRTLDMAARALRSRGRDPATHLAMIRSWAAVTLLAFDKPLTPEQAADLRFFCERRGFDLCWLPGLDAAEANRWHVLDRPRYFEAARALLGPDREAFIDGYLFDIRPATDDRPYFFRSFRWRGLAALREAAGGSAPAFIEMGYLMSVAAFGQAALAAVALIALPLLVRVRSLRAARRRAAVLGYFLLLGVGFMLLEMGLLQKLILYLAHPIYSAAAVIAGFLVFGGLGSQTSGLWRARPRRVAGCAAAAVVLVALVYCFALDGWLGLTQAQGTSVRFLVACATIAPLAFAMGHMFPLGLRQVGAAQPALVPWAWAINGVASVVAAAGAPLLAAETGFRWVILTAVLCYALAGVVFRWQTSES